VQVFLYIIILYYYIPTYPWWYNVISHDAIENYCRFFFYSNIDIEPRVKRRSHYIIKNVYTIHVINILFRRDACVCVYVYVTIVLTDCRFCAHFFVRFALCASTLIVTRPTFTCHASIAYIILIIIHVSYIFISLLFISYQTCPYFFLNIIPVGVIVTLFCGFYI